MELFAFCHVILGGRRPEEDFPATRGEDVEKYGRKALDIAREVITTSPLRNPGFGTAPLARGLALVYDWCHGAARPGELEAIARNLLRRARFAAVHINEEGFNPFVDYDWLEPLLFAAAALSGEGLNDDATHNVLELFMHKLMGQVVPARLALGAKGSWPSRPDGARRTESALLAWTEVLRSAYGEDLYPELPFLLGASRAWIYWTRPDLASAKAGVTEVRSPGVWPSHIYLLSARRGDRVGKYFADLLYDRMFLRGFDRVSADLASECMRLIMWKRDDLVPEVPGEVLAGVRYFDDLGEVVMRSGWDFSPGSRDVWMALRCQKGVGPAAIAGQGHFTIVRGADRLAIAAGYRGNTALPHYRKYAGTSRSHNVVAVGDGPQKPFDAPGGPAEFRECLGARGRIARFDEGPGWVYVFMDLTNSYDRRDVYACHRELFWIKPDLWVILDRLVVAREGTRSWWALHSEGKARILGAADVVEGTETDGVLKSIRATGVSFTAGASELVIVPVLPEQRMVTAAGGPTHAFYCAGRTYGLHAAVSEADLRRNECGSWVVEIEPIEPARNVLFLNLLAVGDAGQVVVPACRASTEGDVFTLEVDLPAGVATVRFRTPHEHARCELAGERN